MPANTSSIPMADIEESTKSRRWAAIGSATGSSGRRRTSSREYSDGERVGQELKSDDACNCGLALSDSARWEV